MAQHDYNLANAAGASFRADANDALAAIVSNNSGASAPTTTFAYQLWADTTTGILKQRNAANSAWIDILTLSSGAAKSVDGTISSATTATTQTAGDNSTKVATTAYADAVGRDKIQPITASVGSNALTITINPTVLDFRSTTLGSGSVTTVSIVSAISMTVSSGSTLGTLNGIQSDLAVLAINNAGTAEVAVVNIAGGVDLSETGLISTTAEGGAGGADSATTIYSATARTNVAYRVIGIIRSTQATAGTWATAPSLIQGAGGQAFTSLMSLGYGQTWQDVTGSRVSGTTYYNTTGKPIIARLQCNVSATPWSAAISVNGTQVALWSYSTITATGINQYIDSVVPPNASYSYTWSSLSVVALELR